MLDPAVHAQLAAILPPSALLTAAEDTEALRVRRAVALPYASRGRRDPRERGAGRGDPSQVPRFARSRRRPRCGDESFGRGDAGHVAASCCRWRNSSGSWRSTHSRARPWCSRACATLRSRKPPRRYGLFYAPDPSSQITCTIGGNVAENAGGVHCLKYGLTVHNVQRVRAVLIDGEIVEFGERCARQHPATTCSRSINGSEGLLAVITEITVKLTPKPAACAGGAGRIRRHRQARRGGAGSHRCRDRSRRTRARWTSRRRARSRNSSTRIIRSTRRPCCWSRATARQRKSPPRWRRSGAC